MELKDEKIEFPGMMQWCNENYSKQSMSQLINMENAFKAGYLSRDEEVRELREALDAMWQWERNTDRKTFSFREIMNMAEAALSKNK